MRPTARPLAALLAAAALLTACGGGQTAEEPDADEAGDQPTDEASDDGDDGDGADGEGETREVEHDQGTTEVPADPQRVVTLDTPHLDAALALDVTPVGAVSVFADQGLPAYLGERVEDVEQVGTIEEPDLEAIAALEPDLILSATVRHEQLYDQLEAIAPTVFTESSGTDWQQGVGLVAEALGEAEQAEQALAGYQQRATELGEEIGAESTQAAIVRFLPGETRIYGPGTFSGGALSDIGLQLPDLEYDQYSMASISTEQVGLLESADAVFSTTYGPEDETTRSEVTELWQQLPAIESGCQFDVADDEWMIGIGLLGAEIILDDVEASLGDGACAG